MTHSVSIPSGPAVDSGFWAQLAALVDSQPAPPAWRSRRERFAPLEDYFKIALACLEEHLSELPAEAEQSWRVGLGLDRARDIERQVLPALIAALRRIAIDGEQTTVLDAIRLLLEFLTRELLRQGMMPVFHPVGAPKDNR
jgi:hypothetical protein